MSILLTCCTIGESTVHLMPLNNIVDNATQLEIPFIIPVVNKDVSALITIDIPVEGQSFDSENLIESYTYIPLETKDECLIGTIDKIECDSCFLFLFDEKNNSLFIFSNMGKFIAKVGNIGRGPQEYIKIIDFAVDRVNSEICLLDNYGSKLLYFDYEGKHLRSSPIYFDFYGLSIVGANMILSTEYVENKGIQSISNSHFLVCDREQSVLYKGFNFPKMSEDFSMRYGNSLISQNDKVYFQTILSDTIWEVKGSLCFARYTFNSPDGKLFDDAVLSLITNNDYIQMKNGKVFYSGRFVQVGDDYSSFGISGSFFSSVLFYSNRTKKIKYGRPELIQKKDAPLPLYFMGWSPSFALNNKFGYVLQSFHILQAVDEIRERGLKILKQDQLLLDSLSEEDNPILMLVKLKDF